MPKIIAIAGLCRGSGKTTVSLNLAASLSLFEKKNLIIDFDIHSGLSKCLRPDVRQDDIIHKYLFSHTDYMSPGFEDSTFFKSIASDLARAGRVFETFIELIAKEYEYVILDLPSEIDFLSISALAACDDVIIVKRNTCFDLEAIQRLLFTVAKLTRVFCKKINILGILSWGYVIPAETYAVPWPLDLKEYVLKVFIPYDKAMESDELDIRPICFKDIMSPAAISYLDLCRHITGLNE